MNGFSLETPESVSRTLAARIKELRLARGWKQATLAQRSGVSLASLRRFEESGQGVAPEPARSRLCPEPAG